MTNDLRNRSTMARRLLWERTGGRPTRAHPGAGTRGALMAENLGAELYRESLRLVLGELDDLDLGDPLDTAQRIGELRAHVRTLVGESGQPPMLGFRGLEDLSRARKERLGPPPP